MEHINITVQQAVDALRPPRIVASVIFQSDEAASKQRRYHYFVPPHLTDVVEAGQRAVVRVGEEYKTVLIDKLLKSSTKAAKYLYSVFDPEVVDNLYAAEVEVAEILKGEIEEAQRRAAQEQIESFLVNATGDGGRRFSELRGILAGSATTKG